MTAPGHALCYNITKQGLQSADIWWCSGLIFWLHVHCTELLLLFWVKIVMLLYECFRNAIETVLKLSYYLSSWTIGISYIFSTFICLDKAKSNIVTCHLWFPFWASSWSEIWGWVYQFEYERDLLRMLESVRSWKALLVKTIAMVLCQCFGLHGILLLSTLVLDCISKPDYEPFHLSLIFYL